MGKGWENWRFLRKPWIPAFAGMTTLWDLSGPRHPCEGRGPGDQPSEVGRSPDRPTGSTEGLKEWETYGRVRGRVGRPAHIGVGELSGFLRIAPLGCGAVSLDVGRSPDRPTASTEGLNAAG
jgi:hypothetical protein